MILARRDVHPFVEMMPHQQDRNDEDRYDRHQHRQVFELPADDDGPFRIGRVVNNDPEKAAGDNSEIKGESKKPRMTELTRRHEGADHAQAESDYGQDREQERQGGKPTGLHVFAFRSWHHVRTLAHFLASSGAGAGGASAGLSSSARRSGGTSASVAFWLRCKARR